MTESRKSGVTNKCTKGCRPFASKMTLITKRGMLPVPIYPFSPVNACRYLYYTTQTGQSVHLRRSNVGNAFKNTAALH